MGARSRRIRATVATSPVTRGYRSDPTSRACRCATFAARPKTQPAQPVGGIGERPRPHPRREPRQMFPRRVVESFPEPLDDPARVTGP
ncbi:hypothetical protein [Prauserella flavalba]|uniref:hypothetical protein n=1 Tax=Prauserella flavalba TaxID=1477506 RepID=UPI0036E5BC75